LHAINDKKKDCRGLRAVGEEIGGKKEIVMIYLAEASRNLIMKQKSKLIIRKNRQLLGFRLERQTADKQQSL